MTLIESQPNLLALDVSRETHDKLRDLESMLAKWNRSINLVSKASLSDSWARHILDSAQIFKHGATARRWADLGSGGGFPGLVVATIAKEKAPGMDVILVESDQRKAAFLRQAGQALGVPIKVLSERIESLPELGADVISARALAPLTKLCAFAARHLNGSGIGIFMKGKAVQDEIAAAMSDWRFDLASFPSTSDPAAVILVVKGLAHV